MEFSVVILLVLYIGRYVVHMKDTISVGDSYFSGDRNNLDVHQRHWRSLNFKVVIVVNVNLKITTPSENLYGQWPLAIGV